MSVILFRSERHSRRAQVRAILLRQPYEFEVLSCSATMSYAAALLLRYLKDSRTVALCLRQGAEFAREYQQIFSQVTRCSSLRLC